MSGRSFRKLLFLCLMAAAASTMAFGPVRSRQDFAEEPQDSLEASRDTLAELPDTLPYEQGDTLAEQGDTLPELPDTLPYVQGDTLAEPLEILPDVQRDSVEEPQDSLQQQPGTTPEEAQTPPEAAQAPTGAAEASAGQEREPSETRVNLLHADRLYFNERKHATAQFLVGNVRFEHEGTLMSCDSALFYQATNSFDAFGNVRMEQGDTLTLTGDVMYYDGIEQMSRVRYNVVLVDGDVTVYSDSMDYDRLFQLGYYFNGGRLVTQNTHLTSDWGEYSPETKEAVFNYNVVLVTPPPPEAARTVVVSDTLHYNTLTSIAHALGPSNIDNGANHVYTEDGYYNTETDDSYLLRRSIVQNGYKYLIGDSVCWSGAEAIGKAYGHAIYTDTLNHNKLYANYILYNDSIGYSEAADSAVLMDFSEPDTLYAHADSFFLYTFNIDTDSMYRMMHGYHKVRAYRVDVQAVCDSLVYDSRDSCTTMYRDPIMWQEGQQVLGEEIKAWRNDSTIDSIYVINQALSVERLDSVHYNQVASKEMHTYMKDGHPFLMIADVNVFVNYYPFDDDSLMIGLNHTESSEMWMYLVDGKINKIWMPAATGTLYPLFLVTPKLQYLENFAWFDYVRPLNKEDIFNWRPKRAGTELKPSVRHEPPKQKLADVRSRANLPPDIPEVTQDSIPIDLDSLGVTVGEVPADSVQSTQGEGGAEVDTGEGTPVDSGQSTREEGEAEAGTGEGAPVDSGEDTREEEQKEGTEDGNVQDEATETVQQS